MSTVPSTPADGYVRYQFIPAAAVPTAPTVAEMTATGYADVSCYLTADGWTPSTSEAVISDDRQCDVATFERPGRVQRSLDVKYIENPTDSSNNLAYATFVPRAIGFIVVRRGIVYSTAFAASQKVQVWPIQAGEYQWQPITANSVLTIVQKMHITGPVVLGVVAA